MSVWARESEFILEGAGGEFDEFLVDVCEGGALVYISEGDEED